MFIAYSHVAMLVTGIILAPAVMATPAVQELTDLRIIINLAASTIGDLQNPNRGWGLFGSSSQMGTADLINNITSTILQFKFQVDTNKVEMPPQTALLNPANVTTDPALNTSVPSPPTPTLPLTSSMVLPSTLPTSTPSLDNATTDLSTPYIDYVSAIPNLSTSLTSLGRAWHREMNSPVRDAIGVLQESINTLQTTMLQCQLISSSAVLRTIRASSTLESSQQAWSRFLNLPSRTGSGDDSEDASSTPSRRSEYRLTSPTLCQKSLDSPSEESAMVIKPEALDAFATRSTRPGALEAATANQGDTIKNETPNMEGKKKDPKSLSPEAEPVRSALNRLNTNFGQHNNGTETPAKAVEQVAQVVEDVVEGVKAVVHEAVAWTEKKAEELAKSEDRAGPYDSPATAAGGTSDLDVIATGVLPATVPVQEDGKDKRSDSVQESRVNHDDDK
ncbi:uncharacterized protein M421DRAFT_89868 [Didymella exigua CBS 183.55]|uniref:Uncharacterized protein n=1 Tax=Didymella exigua CBS 183.55 TaxID=1150837 RepID=A0A6A5RX35_9PLEO|nr:uncharacterized protein M421DRAFT_89868 [Didymella exigua CBS 183.55]KAF1931578.1 hypothetical protein M421DRAFT_89868 [Didymella exigua CBS 183.55]